VQCQPVQRQPVYHGHRHQHIPELTCGFNSSTDLCFCETGRCKSIWWQVDNSAEKGFGISLLGEFDPGNVGRTVHGWRGDLWCSYIRPQSGSLNDKLEHY